MNASSIAAPILAIATLAIPHVSHSQDLRAGRDWYVNECASCHGRTGKGDGPVAKALTKPPADLTKLSQANGGVFPSARVYGFIDGTQDVSAHGPREMPVWGNAARFAPGIVRARIRDIVEYVSALQGR
jgi:mono/diheme cytochrome c family protein